MEEIKLLFLTIIIELPIALIFLRKFEWKRVVLVIVGLNFISHPIVWQALFSHNINWFFAEICVILFETILLGFLFKKNWLLAVCTGVIINITTAFIGYYFF